MSEIRTTIPVRDEEIVEAARIAETVVRRQPASWVEAARVMAPVLLNLLDSRDYLRACISSHRRFQLELVATIRRLDPAYR